jgi:hypothetical protein
MTSIEELVADLRPIKRVKPQRGAALVIAAVSSTVVGIWMTAGLRTDIMAGAPHPIVMLRGGMLLLLGFATLSAVLASAQPRVGRSSNGWRWALAAALLFPLTAAYLSIINGSIPEADLHAHNGPWCLKISCGSALLIGGTLTAWLRTGAPTAINRSAWLVGLAAGSFGAFAYSLHCPSTTITYIGIWYTAALALCAVLGRLIVPPLIRW